MIFQQEIVADNRYVGLEGFVTKVYGLRIYVSGSYWPAQTVKKCRLAVNQIVRVVGRCGITLIVEPIE